MLFQARSEPIPKALKSPIRRRISVLRGGRFEASAAAGGAAGFDVEDLAGRADVDEG